MARSGVTDRIATHLAALDDADPKRRGAALRALRGAAIAYGETTADAARVCERLAARLGDPGSGELAGALTLLADLVVCGEADLWLAKGYDVRGPFFDEAPPDVPGRALYLPVAAQAGALLALLDHPDAAVRAALARLLALMSRETARVLPALAARLPAEPDALVRGALAVAIGHHARYQGAPAPLLTAALTAADRVERLGAAIGLALAGPADDPAVGDALIAAAGGPKKPVAAFPWLRGDLPSAAVIVGSALALARADLALAERLAAAGEEAGARIYALGASLDVAFGDGAPTPRARGELTPAQARVALAAAASDDAWASRPRSSGPASRRSARGVERIAGLGPEGPLDAPVGGEPLVRLGVRAVAGDADARAAWHRALAGLDDAGRLALAADALSPPLWLSGYGPAHTEKARAAAAVDLVATDVATCPPAAILAELAKRRGGMFTPQLRHALVIGACEAAARLGEPPPEAVDQDLAKLNPRSVLDVTERLRAAFATLPDARREAVVLACHFWHGDGEGGPPVHGGAWALVDLAPPTAAVAAHVLEEVTGWSGRDAPYPLDLAATVLARCGPAAAEPLRAARAAEPAVAAALSGLAARLPG
ncbi:MAG: hypothetical protein H6745_05125 [Deltaproteobacteria bacterium]|nr:hypothetical protein [Deltaproteobacteria bacterium]